MLQNLEITDLVAIIGVRSIGLDVDGARETESTIVFNEHFVTIEDRLFEQLEQIIDPQGIGRRIEKSRFGSKGHRECGCLKSTLLGGNKWFEGSWCAITGAFDNISVGNGAMIVPRFLTFFNFYQRLFLVCEQVRGW